MQGPSSSADEYREVLVEFEDMKPMQLLVSAELANVFACASALGEDGFHLTFTSLWLALMISEGAAASSLLKVTSEQSLRRMLDATGLTSAALEEARRKVTLPDPLLGTRSAREVLRWAEQCALDLKSASLPQASEQVTPTSPVLQTRYVVAAYPFMSSHRREFERWRVDPEELKRHLANELSRAYPEQADFWMQRYLLASSKDAPTPTASAATTSVLRADQFEDYALAALLIAGRLAVTRQVQAPDVLRVASVLGATPSHPSLAFAELAKLCPWPSETLPSRPTLSENEWDWLSPPLLQELQRARQVPKLTGRDIIAAALIAADGDLEKQLAARGTSLRKLRNQWFQFVTGEGFLPGHLAVDDWRAWFARARGGERLEGRMGLAAETDEGDDKLGVKDEAHAFARLILDKDVKAPLSIGLLGDWGSGKSFFIEQIRDQICALKEQGRPELYSEVVEIEFNAWHASDANLWASLVTYIFDEIWNATSTEKKGTLEQARGALLRKMEDARGAVHEAEGQVELARSALVNAEADLKRRKQRLAWSEYVKEIATDQLERVATRAGFREALATINDVERASAELTHASSRLRLAATSMLERPFLSIFVPVGLVLGAATWAWQYWDVKLDSAQAFLLTAAGALGTLVAPLQTAARRVGKFADTLGTIRKQYDDAVERAKKLDPKLGNKVAAARVELASAEASVEAARSRLADLLNQQAALDPTRRLGAFLQERVHSTQYRSQQGIISLVHKDFRELSKYMKDLRDNGAKAASSGAQTIVPFDRIVLYVDDLDRCRPDQVVHMLEAVHLLLGLDLFVVVVAVDSRWLTRALEVHYRELLGSSTDPTAMRMATPQSYLEKIFQITYALGPMDRERFKDYVASLAGEPSNSPAATTNDGGTSNGTTTGTTTTTRVGQAAAPANPSDSSAAATRLRQPPTGAAGAGQQAALDAQFAQPTTTPALRPPVRLSSDEQKTIQKLVDLLPTPRIAKRLVNVYRLIKAAMNDDDLEQFERTGRADSCLLMLAVLFGRPSVAAALLRDLQARQGEFGNEQELFLEALARHAARATTDKVQWQELSTALKQIGSTLTVREVAREPMTVARYSLVSGHEWHTWARARSPDAAQGATTPLGSPAGNGAAHRP